MKLSIVLPVYNESPNVPLIAQKLRSVADQELASFETEIIFINDGSKDDSWEKLKSEGATDRRLKLINFRKNFGQTAALAAGIKAASGEVIVTLDSDLENNPADIPRLINKLDEGYDVVSGWRRARWQKEFVTRRLPSMVANYLISTITGVKLHDYGCTLKAYRREVIVDMPLYGEMHRFIPAYASWFGARVSELEVSYQPRQFGKSNYGLSRVIRVLLDLLVFSFLSKYLSRPIHFFGGFGFLSLILGLIAGLMALALKLFDLRDFVETPLPVFSGVLVIVGVQLVIMGILAEMIMRTYYESQGRTTYLVKEKINF